MKWFLGLVLLPLAVSGNAFDPELRRWILQNDVVRASFEMDAQGRFRLRAFRLLATGDEWAPPEGVHSSPIRFDAGGRTYSADSRWNLRDTRTSSIERGGTRETITLAAADGAGVVELELDHYPGQPVLRYRYRYRPAASTIVQRAALLPWKFAGGSSDPLTLHFSQWNRPETERSFQVFESRLDTARKSTMVLSGSFNPHMAYLAVRYESGRGLFAGWEFDGRAAVRVRRANAEGDLHFSGGLTQLNRRVAPGEAFEMPGAFLGLFRGDWDEAGYRVQRFTEQALAQPLPPGTFPWVIWDSWSYREQLDEDTMRRAAELASRMGVELFVLDLGWARNLGDWHGDPVKFPSGIRALSDYVHSLGMRFGLHFALLEAHPDSPVVREHPDWLSSENYWYFGGVSLCPSHAPFREWIVREAVRMIDEYNVDWILQDGENLVKQCTREDHTHAADDSNYANAVEGINWIVREVQKARPLTLWENCEDGGNMLTFNMPQNYVTSITSDDSGPLTTRQAVYAMSYVFPMRYTDRYMPASVFSSYITRSYMFGGPWIHMNRLTEMDQDNLDFAAREVELYKSLRERLRDGRVFHLTPRPDETFIDVMQSLDPATGRAILFAYRGEAAEERRTVALKGLEPTATYRVTFLESASVHTYSGAHLMNAGLEIPVARFSAEIVYVDPL